MIELAPNHKRGLALRSPLMNAAGILGFAGETRGLVDLAALGAFVTNPFTLNSRTPARPPNAVEAPDGVLIHTGLPNPGLKAALRRYPREWQRLGPLVILHLAATTPAETRRAADALEREDRIAGVELGFRDEVKVDELAALVRAMAGAVPLLARLPAGRGVELAEAASHAGADALVLSAPPRKTVREVTGRFYGPSVFAVTLSEIQQVAPLTSLPLIGAGGVFSVANAQQMLAAGAVAVQLDAVLWRAPELLEEWEQAFTSPK
jgi:dihydroorotate dehydrogenase (NAD+) catalytic subunit